MFDVFAEGTRLRRSLCLGLALCSVLLVARWPILTLNTHFNDSEPILCCLQEAFDWLLRIKMDVLMMAPFIHNRA